MENLIEQFSLLAIEVLKYNISNCNNCGKEKNTKCSICDKIICCNCSIWFNNRWIFYYFCSEKCKDNFCAQN